MIATKGNYSISQNLSTSLATVIVSISIVFILIFHYHLSKNSQQQIQKISNDYIRSISSTLEIPLWDLDREDIQAVCSYYFQNDLVVKVELTSVTGESLFSEVLEPEANNTEVIHRSNEIFHNGELIGKVAIALNPISLLEYKYDLLKISVAVLFISVCGIFFFTGFLLKKYLREPIELLSRIATSYAQGNYFIPTTEKRYLEFEPVVSVLSKMGKTIELQLNELQQAECILRKHRDKLEETVSKRTEELESSNRELQFEIQERIHSEKKLLANEQRLEAILKASPVGIGLLKNRHLVWANETMFHMLGYENNALLNRSTKIFYKDLKEYERVGEELYGRISDSKCGSIETQWLRRNGTVFDCLIRGCNLDLNDVTKGQIVAVADMSEVKRLKERLQSAEKMKALGTLAGGVAHDLNNVLSGIVSYPEILLLQVPEDSLLRKPLVTIQKSGIKASEIVQDLLTMARRGVSVRDVVNLNEIITEQLQSPEMDKLRGLHLNVKLKSELAPDLLNVKGSPTHLSKSIMNLLSNAAEAIEDSGEITISTANLYLDSPVRGYERIDEGEYVKVTVSDTGTGMSEDEKKKVFEPFYTKKTMGRSGTGLGMAVVWGTVKDHGGYIDVLSRKGNGSAFTLYFPVTRERLKRNDAEVPIDKFKGKGESILIVDDVEDQREIATAILKTLNYSVNSVPSGEKAIEFLKNNSVDLVILDMIMDSGIDGLETYKCILELIPDQKAVIASGYSKTQRVLELQNLGAGQYIKKPYTVRKIGFAVKNELSKLGKER